MSNELSFEDFFAAGTGAAEPTEKFVISSEGFDGYGDNIMAEAEQALENLNFLDSFEAVSRMNAETKIRMLQKIKNNYNSKTIGRENLGMSIESLCASQIQSLEDAMADKAPAGDKAKTKDTPAINSRAKEFFSTVWTGIKEFFKSIGRFFAKIGRGIANLFKGLKKVEKDVDPTKVSGAIAEASKSSDPEVKKAMNSAEGKAIIQAASKAAVVNGAIDNVNKFASYAADFEKISNRISTVADKMAKSTEQPDSADLQKTVAEFLKKTAKVQMYYSKAFAKLETAVRNTIMLNKALSIYADIDATNDKTDADTKKAKVFAGKFKTGDFYLVDNKIDLKISEQLRKQSGELSAAIEQFVNGKITKNDDPKVVKIRQLSENINKLVLGDNASQDISTIDKTVFATQKLFGVKLAVIK